MSCAEGVSLAKKIARYFQLSGNSEEFDQRYPQKTHVELGNLIYHHDNAPAHRAEDSCLTIDFLGLERLGSGFTLEF